MLKTIKHFFKALELSSVALEKKSEKFLFESQTQLNEYIEKNGGLEKVKEEQRKAEDFMKVMRKY